MEPDMNVEDSFNAIISLTEEKKKLLLSVPPNLARLNEIDRNLEILNQSIADLPMADFENHMAHHVQQVPSGMDYSSQEPAQGNENFEDVNPVNCPPIIQDLDLKTLLKMQAEINSQIAKITARTAPKANLPKAADSNGFKTVTLKRKNSDSKPSQNKAFIIETGNRFEALGDNETEPLSMEAEETNEPTVEFVQKPRRVPPIIITDPVNWPSLSNSLKSIATQEFSGKLNADNLRVHSKNPTDYRAISAYLAEKKISYHTYKLSEEKNLKVVIRGIPSNTPAQDILNELKDRNFPVLAVNQLRGGKNKKPLPLFLIDLQKTPAGKEIFNLNSILYLKVTIESYRGRKGPTQCHSCQRFGHVQSSCFNPHRCVKCAGSHHTRECTKSIETPPKCVNCQGIHTANYRMCPVFANLINRTAPKPSVSSKTRTGFSYSDALIGPKTSSVPMSDKPNQSEQTTSQPITANQNTLTQLIGLIPLIKEIGFDKVKELIVLLNLNPGGLGSLVGSFGTGPLAPNTMSGLSRV